MTGANDYPYTGLPGGHAYTVLGAAELKLDDGSVIELVKMRNPWGNEAYTGPWSDSDSVWTDGYRAQLGHT